MPDHQDIAAVGKKLSTAVRTDKYCNLVFSGAHLLQKKRLHAHYVTGGRLSFSRKSAAMHAICSAAQ
jgi:hypothetical protein